MKYSIASQSFSCTQNLLHICYTFVTHCRKPLMCNMQNTAKKVMKFFNLYGCLQRMTAARSPLNSRGYKVPPDRWMRVTSTPTGSPQPRRWATPLGSMLPTASDSVGRADPRLLRGDAFSVFNRTGRSFSPRTTRSES